jgi:hypothetical protein
MSRIGLSQLGLAQMLATSLCAACSVTMMSAHRGISPLVILPAALLLVAVALAIAYVLRTALHDIYKTLQYREKFLVFIFHASILIAPIVTPIPPDLAYLVVVLLLAAQTHDRIIHNRLLALLWMGSCFSLFSAVLLPPFWLTITFGLSGLLSFRLANLQFRMEGHRGAPDLPLAVLIRRSIPALMVPAVACLSFYLAGRQWLGPRQDLTPRFTRTGEVFLGSIPPSTIMWWAFGIVTILIAIIALLAYFDQLLRSKAKGAMPQVAEAGGSLRAVQIPPPSEVEVPFHEPDDMRRRVFDLVIQKDRQLALEGKGRGSSEPVADWLAVHLPGSESIVDRAAYSALPMTEAEVAQIGALVRQSENERSRKIDPETDARGLAQ